MKILELEELLQMVEIDTLCDAHWKNGDRVDYEDFYETALPEVEWVYKGRENEYQGDLLMVGVADKEYVVVAGSFGSCPGCDMLQESGTQYFQSLLNDIKIFTEKHDAIEYIKKLELELYKDTPTMEKNAINALEANP